MSTLPMVFDDGTSAMVPQEKMQDALRDGGKVVQPMMFDDGSRAMVPLERVHAALQDGGQVIGQAPQRPNLNLQQSDNTSAFSENRFTITPQDGESFSDTMQRAARAGKTVTPAEIGSQSLKGLMEAPAALAAAPAMGAAGAAALTGADLGAYQAARGAGYAVEALKDILPEKATMDQLIKVGKIVRDLSLTTAAGKYLYHTIYGNE